MKAVRFAVLAAVLFAFASPALAKGAKVDICHWDADAGIFFVINISEKAADKHIENHGDVYPATWWFDADGDGYGDPDGATDPCPNTGFVDNDLDCNDGDAAINPGVEEVCNDDIDNNCNGEIDEGCLVCPCFTYDEITDSHVEWQGQNSNNHWKRCVDYDYPNHWYYHDYDYTYIQFYDYNYYYNYSYDYEYYYSFGREYHNGYAQRFCRHYINERGYDENGEWFQNYSYDTIYITEEEQEQCRDLIKAWAGDNGMTCNGQYYYQ